ncbi:hypothetical protein JXA12_01635 [Candidatus Woesearchaeota archaeon]|nr:hypothetical protein [Candidatus Woesearchaeota archaeon]
MVDDDSVPLPFTLEEIRKLTKLGSGITSENNFFPKDEWHHSDCSGKGPAHTPIIRHGHEWIHEDVADTLRDLGYKTPGFHGDTTTRKFGKDFLGKPATYEHPFDQLMEVVRPIIDADMWNTPLKVKDLNDYAKSLPGITTKTEWPTIDVNPPHHNILVKPEKPIIYLNKITPTLFENKHEWWRKPEEKTRTYNLPKTSLSNWFTNEKEEPNYELPKIDLASILQKKKEKSPLEKAMDKLPIFNNEILGKKYEPLKISLNDYAKKAGLDYGLPRIELDKITPTLFENKTLLPLTDTPIITATPANEPRESLTYRANQDHWLGRNQFTMNEYKSVQDSWTPVAMSNNSPSLRPLFERVDPYISQYDRGKAIVDGLIARENTKQAMHDCSFDHAAYERQVARESLSPTFGIRSEHLASGMRFTPSDTSGLVTKYPKFF